MIRRKKMTKPHPIFALSMGHLLAFSLLLNVTVVLFAFFRTSSCGSNSLNIHMQSLQWHGGHGTSDLQKGSCYCNAESYCLCTPNLAIDLVILSGSDHVWLVRRKDTNQLATMGGFVQVGETVEAAVKREIMEEMGIQLREPPVLFGVYSDPRRDNRRHTVSVTYAVHLDESAHPVAADDVKEVKRVPLADIEKYSFFADHKTILTDFRNLLLTVKEQQSPPLSSAGDFANDIIRSVCSLGEDAMSVIHA